MTCETWYLLGRDFRRKQEAGMLARFLVRDMTRARSDRTKQVHSKQQSIVTREFLRFL